MKYAMLFTVVLAALLLFTFYGAYAESQDLRDARSVTRVFISPALNDALNERFGSSQDEFFFCLYGELSEDNVTFTSWSEPEIYISSGTGVEAAKCDGSPIGTIHSHNNFVCRLSVLDAYSFGFWHDAFMGVMCDDGEFAFWSPKDLESALYAEVLNE